ncbi:MAG: (2Fe-2S)-binding protein [Actinobacteria bacterium]|nr:(2Fe-2S)-binding protein [Actinomycetota bacterium]
MTGERKISLRVNGRQHELEVEPRLSLADALRNELGYTGTHLGCEHGMCGACTVWLDGKSVRSCLMLAALADGAEVTTIEGLAPDGDSQHPLQAAFSKHHALQCGFCTPGMIMAAADLLQQNPHPSEEEVVDWMGGNICRCTGYRAIVRAVMDVAESGAAPPASDPEPEPSSVG